MPNQELLLKLASIPTGAAPPLDDVAWHVMANKADAALVTRWGLNASDRNLCALLRAYAEARLALSRAETEIVEILKERDVLRMQLGKAKKQIEKAKEQGNEPDTAAE